jgi:heme oxygenase
MGYASEPSSSDAAGRTLSERLRAETKSLHTAAERAGMMQRLVRGQLSRVQYLALVANLAELYGMLEQQLDRHRGHAAIRWLDLNTVCRRERLEQDLRALRRSEDSPHPIVASTKTYVDRLRRLGDETPELLVAHAYVRYLGDLSGGRVLAPIVARLCAREGVDAARFYDFPLIPDPDDFKRRFREALDRFGGGDAADRMVGEAKEAFALHEQLFRELEHRTC